jgi:hypothetical protein
MKENILIILTLILVFLTFILVVLAFPRNTNIEPTTLPNTIEPSPIITLSYERFPQIPDFGVIADSEFLIFDESRNFFVYQNRCINDSIVTNYREILGRYGFSYIKDNCNEEETIIHFYQNLRENLYLAINVRDHTTIIYITIRDDTLNFFPWFLMQCNN